MITEARGIRVGIVTWENSDYCTKNIDEEGIARIQPLVKMLHPERHQRASFSWHILAQAVDQEIDAATKTVRFPDLVLRVSLILGST